MKNVFLFFLILFTLLSNSQNIFSEKFNDCSTDGMSLESDSIYTQTNISELIKLVKSNLSENDKIKLIGILNLQIVVNQNGSSCLISYKNETNIESSKFELKKTIDQNLVWTKLENLVSSVILLNFTEDKIIYRRIGFNRKKGNHIIEEKTFNK